jgi:carbon monoxide dehydrogenase subunit G
MALDMTGEYVLPLPAATVWKALNDPVLLKASIPGCESFEPVGENEFAAVACFAVGPVKARFRGRVRLQDFNPPVGYKLVGEGEGGVTGFAKGNAAVELAEVPEGTRLTYRAEAQIGGKIAQLGQRLVTSTAKKMADRFFATFVALLTKNEADARGEAAAAPPA